MGHTSTRFKHLLGLNRGGRALHLAGRDLAPEAARQVNTLADEHGVQRQLGAGQQRHAALQRGHEVLLGGTYNGVTFAYLSTDRDLGVVTEIFDGAPGRDQEPDRIYPAPA